MMEQMLQDVMSLLKNEGWHEIDEDFIKSWFCYFYDKGLGVEDIVTEIINEFDLANDEYYFENLENQL